MTKKTRTLTQEFKEKSKPESRLDLKLERLDKDSNSAERNIHLGGHDYVSRQYDFSTGTVTTQTGSDELTKGEGIIWEDKSAPLPIEKASKEVKAEAAELISRIASMDENVLSEDINTYHGQLTAHKAIQDDKSGSKIICSYNFVAGTMSQWTEAASDTRTELSNMVKKTLSDLNPEEQKDAAKLEARLADRNEGVLAGSDTPQVQAQPKAPSPKLPVAPRR